MEKMLRGLIILSWNYKVRRLGNCLFNGSCNASRFSLRELSTSRSNRERLGDEFATPFKDISDLLSPAQATEILRANEVSRILTRPGAVKTVEWNQLGSNTPIEDTLAVAHSLPLTQTILLNVFSLAGGGVWAWVLKKTLPFFIIAIFVERKLLVKNSDRDYNGNFLIGRILSLGQLLSILSELVLNEFLEDVADTVDLVPELHELYTLSLLKYAFLRLDDDLSKEALASRKDQNVALATMTVAMSGAVSSVAHVHNNILSVANVGDCQAVLGTLGEDGRWMTTKLSSEHTVENSKELNRLFSEHPPKEKDSIIVMDRLLGQLMPLRAFGDFRFKWEKAVIQEHAVPHFSKKAVPPNYCTPPYLTARPEIMQRHLSNNDKFLILATDGLWDQLTPSQAVKLVGEHMLGHEALGPLILPPTDVSLGVVHDLLLKRRENLSKRPEDMNVATHLLRHALAGTATGLDHDRLAQLLTMPEDIVRHFRDDISIIVVYFDSEYLLKYPFHAEMAAELA
nr:EOG090X05SW [Artemia franciscana]